MEVSLEANGFELVRWLDELDLAHLNEEGITPDGFFEAVREDESGPRRSAFFVEVEVASVSRSHWRKRLAAYHSFYYSGKYSEMFGGLRSLRPHGNGSFVMQKSIGGSGSTLRTSPLGTARAAGQMNRLRFEVRGSEVRVFLNGEAKGTVSDPVLMPRPLRVNLAVWDNVALVEGEDARVIFDNVLVSSIP
jgi:hypothetical protein